jgi:hypothetical protein
LCAVLLSDLLSAHLTRMGLGRRLGCVTLLGRIALGWRLLLVGLLRLLVWSSRGARVDGRPLGVNRRVVCGGGFVVCG